MNVGKIEVNASFEWCTVCEAEGKPYLFPRPITAYMRQQFKKPAIYRWIVSGENDELLVYIGETQKLCPDRLNGYLEPGPTQETNLRINRQFQEWVIQGCEIKLETLRLSGAFVNDLMLSEAVLAHQDTRRWLEKLLITLYRRQGVKLLNL